MSVSPLERQLSKAGNRTFSTRSTAAAYSSPSASALTWQPCLRAQVGGSKKYAHRPLFVGFRRQ